MANWDVDWQPQKIMSETLNQRVLISPFESGKEQRRKKWAKEKHRFFLSWDHLDKDTYYEIRAFFKDRDGTYDNFNFPNYGQQIKGTRLECINSNPDTITDSSSDFTNFGFDASYDICINDSDAGNDGYYGIQTAIAGTLTLDGGESISAESANADLVVYKTYNVRFFSNLNVEFLTPDLCRLSIELIEIF